MFLWEVCTLAIFCQAMSRLVRFKLAVCDLFDSCRTSQYPLRTLMKHWWSIVTQKLLKSAYKLLIPLLITWRGQTSPFFSDLLGNDECQLPRK